MNYLHKKNIISLFSGVYISPVFYNFLYELLEELGIDKKSIEKSIGHSLKKFPSNETIPIVHLYELWMSLLKISKRSDIGLIVADYFSIKQAGIVGELFLGADNLKDAINIVDRYFSLIFGITSMKFEENEDIVIFYFDIMPRYILPMSAVECFAKITYNWIMKYIKVDILLPYEIHFCFPKPEHHISFYKANFPNCNMIYKDDENYAVFDRSILYITNKYKPSKGFSYIKNYTESLKKDINSLSDIIQISTKAILQYISTRKCNIKTVANEMDMSVSTLKRKLAEEKTTFKKLLERIRKDLSKEMLKDKTLSLEEISFLLGYSEYSSFYRAFKSWYNMTPGNYLNKLG